MRDKKRYNVKLKLVLIESILTYGALGMCIPIMTVFWNSIGMDQRLIGLSQLLCSITMLLFDVPMGYIADRFNRKIMNLLGDLGLIFTFLIYMSARSFITVVVVEVLCGVFMAMTNGVDNSFLKFYSDKLDGTGELFKKNNAKLSIYQIMSFVTAIIIGMIISKFSIRATIGAVAIPFVIGTILSFFIDDIGAKIESKEKGKNNVLSDLKDIFKDSKTKWLAFAFAITNNISHAIIWIFTPLLILAGVPVYIVGIGWILNYATPIIGAMIARKLMNLKLSTKFILPFSLLVLGTLPIIINLNIYTVWLFALTGSAMGFNKTFFLPALQNAVEDKYQTTLVSTATTIARLIYLPSVYFINLCGNTKPQNGLIANLAIFTPLTIIVFLKLKSFEKKAAE